MHFVKYIWGEKSFIQYSTLRRFFKKRKCALVNFVSQIYLAGTARISCMRRKCSMYRTHGASKRQLLQSEELLMSEWPDLPWSSWWHHPTVWKRAMVRSRCRNPFFHLFFFIAFPYVFLLSLVYILNSI